MRRALVVLLLIVLVLPRAGQAQAQRIDPASFALTPADLPAGLRPNVHALDLPGARWAPVGLADRADQAGRPSSRIALLERRHPAVGPWPKARDQRG